MKATYPKLTREESKNCKLTDDNIAEIRQLYDKGVSRSELAEQFRVNSKTIQYWTNEEYRKKQIEKTKARHMRLYRNSEDYRKKVIQTIGKNIKIYYQERRAYVLYMTERKKIYYCVHKDKARAWEIANYIKNKDKIKKYKREWYLKKKNTIN